jgi:preprotein translocase subunit SecG
MDLAINILVGLFVFVALLMMLVILMQRPRSEGLGAAFGGGVTENIFGAQTTNVLTKITGWLAAIFFLLTFVLSILYARQGNMQSNLHGEIIKSQTPAPSASAAPIAPAMSPGSNPGPSSAVSPAATVTNTAPATTSPAPSIAASVAPTTAAAVSPKASAAPSASPKP